jgi:hypothetical protein
VDRCAWFSVVLTKQASVVTLLALTQVAVAAAEHEEESADLPLVGVEEFLY